MENLSKQDVRVSNVISFPGTQKAPAAAVEKQRPGRKRKIVGDSRASETFEFYVQMTRKIAQRARAKDLARQDISRDPRLKGTSAIPIGIYLIDNLNWEKGHDFHSAGRIAEDLGIDRATAKRNLRLLEKCGFTKTKIIAAARGQNCRRHTALPVVVRAAASLAQGSADTEETFIAPTPAFRAPTRGISRPQCGGKHAPLTSEVTSEEEVTPLAPQGGRARIDYLDRDVSELRSAFDDFWKAFPGAVPPHGRKTDRAKCFETFKQIVSGTHRKPELRARAEDIVGGAKRYAATKPDAQFIPKPMTWLNGGRWTDYPQPRRGNSGWTQDREIVSETTDAEWRALIAEHADGIWRTSRLGPPPGSPNCIVPKHLIEELGLIEIYDDNGLRRC